MVTRKNTPDARNRILQAAVKIFAEKSFEGSRIEEIAKEANVPKSLIYYHFKNKDEMFEVLVHDFIKEYTNIIKSQGSHSHKPNAEEMKNSLQNDYTEFIAKNTDLIRIIFIDSLKKSTDKPIIYKIVEAMIETEESNPQISKSHNYNRDERLIGEFFTGVVPLLSYLCFQDSWINYFNMNKEECDTLFLKIMTTAHEAYHKQSSQNT
ncbi:MAG: TetR/AcrR family transcriptional regulator [Bacillota bacterium]|nr:TetR/AcrR family transcriptional regulator [Bacillota bacterium]